MIIIIETIKAFDIDKKVLAYFSVVLGKAMDEEEKKPAPAEEAATPVQES